MQTIRTSAAVDVCPLICPLQSCFGPSSVTDSVFVDGGLLLFLFSASALTGHLRATVDSQIAGLLFFLQSNAVRAKVSSTVPLHASRDSLQSASGFNLRLNPGCLLLMPTFSGFIIHLIKGEMKAGTLRGSWRHLLGLAEPSG